MSMDYLNFEWR